MQPLHIKDLPINEELDSDDMAAIRGGVSIMNITAPNLGLALPVSGSNEHHPGHGGGAGGGDGGGGLNLGDGSNFYSED